MFKHNPVVYGCPSTNMVACSGDEFYVSYNEYDYATYGCDTTALVWGQMQYFFVLNGDHRKEYEVLIPLGFQACYEYFKDHADQRNKMSEPDRKAMELELKMSNPCEYNNWRLSRYTGCII